MIDFIQEFKGVIVAVHVLGAALGLGGATITDVSFFRALRDKKISNDELNILKGLTLVIWIGVAILIVTGVLLFSLRTDELLMSAKFVAKMLAVLVLVINGLLLGLVITPRLQQFDFTFEHPESGGKRLHRLSFSLGAISATSWYSAFILAFVPVYLDIGRWVLAGVYIGLLVAAIIGGQILYMLSNRMAHSKTQVK